MDFKNNKMLFYVTMNKKQESAMSVDQFRSVLSRKVFDDAQFSEGTRAPAAVTGLMDGLDHFNDPASTIPSHELLLDADMKTDVHIEKPRMFMYRNGKDHRLTIQPSVHVANPKRPGRMYTVPAEDYVRYANSLQRYWSGISGRFESLNGKRKPTSDTVTGDLMDRNYGDPSPLQNIPTNIDAAPRGTDNLVNFPNVVEFALDMNTKNPAAVDDGDGVSGMELAKQANENFQASENRFMPPPR